MIKMHTIFVSSESAKTNKKRRISRSLSVITLASEDYRNLFRNLSLVSMMRGEKLKRLIKNQHGMKGSNFLMVDYFQYAIKKPIDPLQKNKGKSIIIQKDLKTEYNLR